ncbi:MAG: NAD(P)H-dependent oxidoreductase [Calditrichia bacterium]
MNLLESLRWRYATKRMNGKKITREKLDIILEAIRLAPTSYGLQPFRVFVIQNEDLLKKIQPIAMNQPQITTCSHLLVFAAKLQLTQDDIDAYIELIAKERNTTVESLLKFRHVILKTVLSKSDQAILDWNTRQTYIAMTHAIIAAATEKVDATPMEGFDPDQLDVLLGLNELGLRSTVLLPLGYRDTELDSLAHQRKVRKPHLELFQYITEDVDELVK